MTTLTPGDTAPAFKAPDQNDRLVALADHADGKLFIFFYPKADTGG